MLGPRWTEEPMVTRVDLVCDTSLRTVETRWTFGAVRLTGEVVIETGGAFEWIGRAFRAVVTDCAWSTDGRNVNCHAEKVHNNNDFIVQSWSGKTFCTLEVA